MQTCTHKVTFRVNEEKGLRDISIVYTPKFCGVCPLCGYELNEQEIKDALLRTYLREDAILILETARHKKAYIENVCDLFLGGITIDGLTTPYTPRIR